LPGCRRHTKKTQELRLQLLFKESVYTLSIPIVSIVSVFPLLLSCYMVGMTYALSAYILTDVNTTTTGMYEIT